MKTKKDKLLEELKEGGIYAQSVQPFENELSRATFSKFEDAFHFLLFLYRRKHKAVRKAKPKLGEDEGGPLKQWATNIAVNVYGIHDKHVDKAMEDACNKNEDISHLWPEEVWKKPNENVVVHIYYDERI